MIIGEGTQGNFCLLQLHLALLALVARLGCVGFSLLYGVYDYEGPSLPGDGGEDLLGEEEGAVVLAAGHADSVADLEQQILLWLCLNFSWDLEREKIYQKVFDHLSCHAVPPKKPFLGQDLLAQEY